MTNGSVNGILRLLTPTGGIKDAGQLKLHLAAVRQVVAGIDQAQCIARSRLGRLELAAGGKDATHRGARHSLRNKVVG